MPTKPVLEEASKCRVDYALPEKWSIPEGFELTSFPGLLSCQIFATNGGSGQLRTEWTSEDVFRSHSQAPFERIMRLGAPLLIGRMLMTYATGKPWWRTWQGLYSLLITLVAVGTNVQTLEGILAYFLAAPNVTITCDEMAPILVVGEKTAVSYSVHNSSRAPSSVRIWFNHDELGTNLVLTPSYANLVVPPSEIRQLSIKLDARTVGGFALRCLSEVRAGKWQPTTGHPILTNSVSVWYPIQRTNTFELDEVTPTNATYVIHWRHGSPTGTGIRYQAIVSDLSDCSYLQVDRGKTRYNFPGGDSPTIVWEESARPRKVDTFRLYVGSRLPHPEEFWRKLNIQLSADEN